MRLGRTVVLVALAATLLLTGALQACQADTPPARAPELAPSTAGRDDPLAALRRWDRRRAAAYSDGDAAALRRLYVARSTAGRRDVRLLHRYAARGLRVTGMQTQLLAARVRSVRPDRLVIVVTDRVTGAVAVGRRTRVRLPDGAARDCVIVLIRRGGHWLVASVGEDADGRDRGGRLPG